MICPRQTQGGIGNSLGNKLRLWFELEAGMGQINNPNRHLNEYISRALNKVRKPSTAEEITERLNRDLGLEDRPFRVQDVAMWLRNAEESVLTLYWLKTRPRR